MAYDLQCMRWSISRMRWNWMGQLFGQSLQHGANWKEMSAAGAGAGAGAADADGTNAAAALLLLHPILQFSGPHGRAAMVERREPLGLAIHGSGLACLASLGGGAGKRGVNAVRKGA
jgi:hypothetical protein